MRLSPTWRLWKGLAVMVAYECADVSWSIGREDE
jgi:hypothetical protein